jgi:hypothetical protein
MGRPRGVNQAGACGLERSRSWVREPCGPPPPSGSFRRREVDPRGPDTLVGKKTPLLAADAAQGRGPDLAFGSRVDDERARHCGLVIAPYLLVACRDRRHGDRYAPGPVQAPWLRSLGPIASKGGEEAPANWTNERALPCGPSRSAAGEEPSTRTVHRPRPDSPPVVTPSARTPAIAVAAREKDSMSEGNP